MGKLAKSSDGPQISPPDLKLSLGQKHFAPLHHPCQAGTSSCGLGYGFEFILQSGKTPKPLKKYCMI